MTSNPFTFLELSRLDRIIRCSVERGIPNSLDALNTPVESRIGDVEEELPLLRFLLPRRFRSFSFSISISPSSLLRVTWLDSFHCR